LKLTIPIALAVSLALPVQAQDFGSALLSGIGNSALKRGDTLLKAAPNEFEDFIKSTGDGKEFATEAECLGALQTAINTGVVLANLLPFSSVETAEDDRGPAARFRIMLNGAKYHFAAYCRESQMVTAQIPWGNGDGRSLHTETIQSTFDAGAGLLLLLHAQGAFEKEDALIASESYGDQTSPPEVSEPQSASENPSGPPLSSGEREYLRMMVSACWNIGALSTDAARTTVIVKVDLNQDGTPIASTIRLASSSGGSEGAVRQAFEVARRAIIRCGSRGFNLPAEKYDHWKTLVIPFDPMRSR